MRFATGLRYILWCGSRSLHGDTTCPGCGNSGCRPLKRKRLVTWLFECPECGLRFRVPKDDERVNRAFYQEEYECGFTTGMPSHADLSALLANGFAGRDGDYTRYVEVLKATGIRPGMALIDFGCSWGYGSHQLRAAGFDVVSYEISEPRAAYAAEKLGLKMLEDPSRPPRPVDCFFSAHVMEHLPDPNIIWRVALSALNPRGIFIAFVPNGDPQIQGLRGAGYHHLWGKLHPLLITGQHLQHMANKYGFAANVYSSPYPLQDIAERRDGHFTGDEMLVVARRSCDG
jgi:2-polyprenyl-3-methyl-5-hydroxy-6-metoxy-1,4-benzoquinol methylase